MAIVVINTPQGPKTVRIAGTKPNEEELRRMKEVFPAPEGQASTYKVREVVEEEEEEVTQSPTAKRPQGGRIEEGVSGEIEDKTFRFDLGQMDTIEEKAGMLVKEFGREAVQFNPETTNFIIDQSLVPSHKRKEYGLSRYGRIYADSPEVNWSDVIDFGGEAGPELVFGTVAAIATMGWSLPASAVAVGLAAGGGKAVAETIDWARGLNEQTASEVGANIALVTAIDGVATYGFGMIGKGLGRMWKGSGPNFDQARVDELLESGRITGLFKKRKAERIAREEEQARYTRILGEQGKPSIEAATGKALAARALKVNELIIGNSRVARENQTWVRKQINELKDGSITEKQFKKRLNKTAKAIARLIRIRTADPVKMADQIDQQLRGVIAPILKDFEDAYVPGFGVPPQLYDRVKMATNLFKNQSSALYEVAYRRLGAHYIPVDGFLRKLDDIRTANPIAGEMPGKYFDNFAAHVDEATTKYRLELKTNATPFVSGIKELEQLKAEIRASAGSPELVGRAYEHQIRNLANAVDDAVLQAQRDFAEVVTHKGMVPIRANPKSIWSQTRKTELVGARMADGASRKEATIQVDRMIEKEIADAEELGRAAITKDEAWEELYPGMKAQLEKEVKETQMRGAGVVPGMPVGGMGSIIQGTPPGPVTINTIIDAMEKGKTSVGIPEYRMGLELDPVSAKDMEQGLAILVRARDHWSKGMEIYNTGAVNTIIKNIDGGFWADDRSLWQHIIKPNDPGVLEKYLKAATPSNDFILPIIRKEKARRTPLENKPSFVIEKALEKVKEGDLGGANNILRNGLGKKQKLVERIDPEVARIDKNLAAFTGAQKAYQKYLEDLKLMVEAGADPQAYRNATRDNLAKVWDGQARLDSTIKGVFEPGVYANKFFALEKQVQDLLFGKKRADAFRKVLPEMWLVGSNKDQLLKALPTFARELGAKPGRPIITKIERLKTSIKNNEDMSDGDLLRALKMGKLENPMDVFNSIMKHPEGYDKLKAVVGKEILEARGGFNDRALAHILYSSTRGGFNALDIQSGKWGRALRDQLDTLDDNGALTKVFGENTVNGLSKIAKDAMDVSDIPLSGYGGLAAATTSLAIMAAILSFSLGSITAGAVTLTGAFVLSRALRNPFILKSMTSTRFTKNQYEAAIRAGANLPAWKQARQDNPLIFALNYAARFGAREAGLIAQSGILGMPLQEAARRPEIAAVPGIVTSLGQAARQQQDGEERQQMPQRGLPMRFPSIDEYRQSLYELEQRKLMGVQ
jgi:hypothetical protein